MKESISGITLFNIVIVFILLFAGYISMSINYSKAYNVKNEILNIIRNEGGVCTATYVRDECYNFAAQITEYFREANYRSTGNCEEGWVGYDREGQRNDNNPAFCVRGVKVNSNSELPNALYYQVEVFYQLDLPIFSSLFEFSVYGETGRIYSPNECKRDASRYEWCRQ